MRKFIVVVGQGAMFAAALALSACGSMSNPIADKVVPEAAQVASDVTTYVQKDIYAVSKTTVPDLQRALDVANTIVVKADGTTAKVDPHGAQCYAGLIIVNQNANAVLATATAAGTASSKAGLITQAEVMTIFAPESPPFQDAKAQIFQSCFAKFQDAQTAVGAVANPALLFQNLPLIAPAIAPALAAG